MNIKDLIDKDLIILDSEATSKEEVLSELVELLSKKNILTSKKEFYNEILEREKVSPTGLEDGLAIPHSKSDCVLKAQIAVARLKSTIDNWESVDDDNKVNLIFLLAIPNKEKGTTINRAIPIKINPQKVINIDL